MNHRRRLFQDGSPFAQYSALYPCDMMLRLPGSDTGGGIA